MNNSPYAWDAEYDFKPIWRAKPADRADEVERQLSHASHETEVTDLETGNPIVEVMWVVSKFATKPEVARLVSHGTSTSLDGYGKDGIAVSYPGDADVKIHTISQHLIGAIFPVTQADWDVMGDPT